MKVISRFIRKAPANITVDAFLKGVTEAVRKKYSSKRIDFYAGHPEERITASCIVYSRLQRQLWIIGDCQCLVGKTGCKDARERPTGDPRKNCFWDRKYES